MERYLEQLDLAEMMEELDGFFPEFALDFSKVFGQILRGDVKGAFESAWGEISGAFLAQMGGMRQIMVSILILGLLSMLVSGLADGVENRQIVDITHYLFFLLLLTILLKIFWQCYQTAQGVLDRTTQFSRLTLPALCLSLGPSTGTLTAVGYYELAMAFIFLMESFLLRLCLPLLSAFMLLLLMNGVWEEGKLSALMELLEQGLSGAVKVSLTAVAGLGVLQSMVAPALDSLQRNTVQKVIAAVPGFGGIAESAAQVLIGSALLIKNSLGLLLLLSLLVLAALPLLKLFLYAVLLKVCSALIGIVADKRLSNCVNKTADAVFLALKLSGAGTAGFFILTAIMTCLVGR